MLSSTRSCNGNNRSSYWNHFTEYLKDGLKRAQCNYCEKNYKKDGTGNMKNHLFIKHPEKLIADVNDSNETVENAVVPRDEGNVEPDFDEQKARELFLAFIVGNSHPFTLIEETYFRMFMQYACPKFTLVCASTVANWIAEAYVISKNKFRSYLKNQARGKMSFTTDLWTSPNNLSIMTLTGAWIDRTAGVIREAILAFREVEGEHSGANIFQVAVNIFKEFDLEKKIFCITTDNASSNSTFVQCLAEYCDNNGLDFKLDNWIRCLAHVINLSVKEALKHFRPLLAKLRKLIKAVRASPQRLKKLKAFAGTDDNDELVPILDVDTRWSSSFDMIVRALKIRTPLENLTNSERDLRRLELEDEEWTLLIEIQSFLKPFAEITRVAEGSKYPTLVFAVPLYNSLMIVLDGYEEEEDELVHDDLIIRAAKSANSKLKTYYNKTTSIYLIATILDPRLKLEYFKENDWDSEIQDRLLPLIKDSWAQYRPRITMTLSTNRRQDDSLTSSLYKKRRVTCQLEDYLAMETESGDCDILKFWQNSEKRWPELTNMAFDFLTISASSAASERSFSGGKDLISDNRNQLSPELIEMSICLRSWLKGGIISPCNKIC